MSPALTEGVLFVHAFATLAMCGLCWFVQVVHYPLFAEVGAERFRAYEAQHVRRTTRIVAPLMLAELGAAGALVMLSLRGDAGVSPSLAWAGAALLALVWASTFGVQVPLHGRLQRAYDPGVARALVRSNWIRTALWTARGGLSLAMLWQAATWAARPPA